jgi:hypothetical protein
MCIPSEAKGGKSTKNCFLRETSSFVLRSALFFGVQGQDYSNRTSLSVWIETESCDV